MADCAALLDIDTWEAVAIPDAVELLKKQGRFQERDVCRTSLSACHLVHVLEGSIWGAERHDDAKPQR